MQNPSSIRPTAEKFSYTHRGNLDYVDQLYQDYLQDPKSVGEEWQQFFEGVDFATSSDLGSGGALNEKELNVYHLIKAYQDYGHLKADLDPLKLCKRDAERFALKNFKLEEADLNSKFNVGSVVGKPNATLKEIVAHLEKSYCGTITAQTSDCEESVRAWFHKEFESQYEPDFSADKKKRIFESLARTESLEKFIHTRYVGTKRFSVEGGDALLPMLEAMVETGTSLGVEEFVIGMAHRGRVNVLANFMDKGLDIIFADFDGKIIDKTDYDGDVKYHMGYSADKDTEHGPCHISLAFNPSHLECVNPVVCGMSRAKQRRRDDVKERKKVVPLQIHGDAAFAGQGVVPETLQLSQLPGYTVGGSLHIIVNNQVGFTTNPDDSRSARYSSDTAKAIKAPVILVNGDDVESCVRAMNIALKFRQEFKQDVVIDMICYRRYGHNEGDEPAFTQPEMYAVIKKHPTLMKLYLEELDKNGILSKADGDAFYKKKIDNLQEILDKTRENPPELKFQAFEGLWKGLRRGNAGDFEKPVDTKMKKTDFDKVAEVLTEVPQNFNIHPKVKKLIDSRKKMIEDNKIDWGLGELLAYGSLVIEGSSVRLSGQDCKRGTFTHRHAVYFDKETGEEHCPIETLESDKNEFCVYNSSLSEMAVLGFEYGNASTDPTFLTIWEAQFGDFANGAQIIIDQFLTSGEQKWSRMSGLTLLLPHGYEGQGPEHSSARLERFLQMCAQENMQVCNITTPANLFHLFRRQIKRDFRKPLVIMSPKSLLRHPKVHSTVEELTDGKFQEVIEDPTDLDPKTIEKVILCTGKIYYDLDKYREENPEKAKKTAVVRIEQLYPLAKWQIAPYLNGFPKLKRVIWAQEEPRNMGAYQHIHFPLRELLDDLGLKKVELEYIGRTERASPAVGSPRVHLQEQNQILEQSFS